VNRKLIEGLVAADILQGDVDTLLQAGVLGYGAPPSWGFRASTPLCSNV
jgi:hypothetical protein